MDHRAENRADGGHAGPQISPAERVPPNPGHNQAENRASGEGRVEIRGGSRAEPPAPRIGNHIQQRGFDNIAAAAVNCARRPAAVDAQVSAPKRQRIGNMAGMGIGAQGSSAPLAMGRSVNNGPVAPLDARNHSTTEDLKGANARQHAIITRQQALIAHQRAKIEALVTLTAQQQATIEVLASTRTQPIEGNHGYQGGRARMDDQGWQEGYHFHGY